MSLTVRIAQWYAVSNRLTTPEHWQAWANHSLNPLTLPESRPELTFLPALQRRRLSLSARLMFQAAHHVVGEQSCPTVLVSHDGELNRSLDLWQALWREQSVSPTSFGLSVHNALVGQWSIFRQDPHEHTVLAAKQDGWELAIVEAAALLAEGAKQVLVLAVDDPLSIHLPLTAQRAPFSYAVAAIVVAGSQWQLSPHTPSSSTGDYWGALHWVKHQYQQHFKFFNPNHSWQWQTLP